VLAWLNRHKRYPSGAKSRREEGSVQVSFTIDASGRVTGSRVVRSSGSPDLDRAALDMVQRASPVPAPPKEIARSRMSLNVPVMFNLR
jgi:protein TonB